MKKRVKWLVSIYRERVVENEGASQPLLVMLRICLEILEKEREICVNT